MVRSAITNGSRLLSGVDARSAHMRRWRDLKLAYESQFAPIDEAKSAIIESIVWHRIQLGILYAKGEATLAQIETGQRTSNSMRRLLESPVLRHQPAPRDVTPTLEEYLRNRQTSRSTAPNGAVDRDTASEAAE
jgi:hypothetical protein